MSAITQLQPAIVAALEVDGPLGALLGATADDSRIYDAVAPDGIVGRFLVWSRAGETDDPTTFGTDGYTTVGTLHAWDVPDPAAASRTIGGGAVMAMYSRVRQILTGATWGVSGLAVVEMRVALVTTLVSPDTLAAQAVIRVGGLVYEVAA